MENGCRYLGCDGAHSLTRELSGIVLEGDDIAEPWAVFDTTIQGWNDDFELNAGYLDAVPVILTALPNRRWRVYLRPSSAESDLVEDATSTVALRSGGGVHRRREPDAISLFEQSCE